MKKGWVLLLVLSLGSGCYFPVPNPNKASIQKMQNTVRLGSTTRGEIISVLGEPDINGDGYIFYRKRRWKTGHFFYFYYGAHYKATFLDMYFEFDNFEVLSDCRIDGYTNSFTPIDTVGQCSISENKKY